MLGYGKARGMQKKVPILSTLKILAGIAGLFIFGCAPSVIITPPAPTGTPPVTETESPRRFGLSLLFGVAIIVIGGLLWWRFSRKR